MIMDRLTQFCDAESVANAAGTDLIGDVIDIENLRDLGQGNQFTSSSVAKRKSSLAVQPELSSSSSLLMHRRQSQLMGQPPFTSRQVLSSPTILP